jgi:peptidoglycan/xylan/chitin deacetylase (PgdA/CDA1 family)
MSAAGMEINSHSLSHPHLRTLEREAAIKEIGESKSLLEKRLGKRVTAFAYPFGEYNQDIIDLVKKAGYESAVTIASGYNQRADAVYQLRRTRISYGDTFSSLKTPLP